MDKLLFYRNFYEQPAMRYEDVASKERVSKDLEMMPYKINLFFDLGCGDGTILDQLSSYFFKVALDISYNMLVRLKAENKLLARSNALPFWSNYYDRVVYT